MHFGDSIFIFLLALVLFGPKKLPEIGRTIGKLLAEFRRASNEFKFQIQEELRNMEEDERRKNLAEAQARNTAEIPAPAESPAAPTILPPSTGTPVSTGTPYATPAAPAEPIEVADSVAPSAAEVIVDSPPSSIATPVIDSIPEPPADIDPASNTNGVHPPAAEAQPAPSSLPGETIHHG